MYSFVSERTHLYHSTIRHEFVPQHNRLYQQVTKESHTTKSNAPNAHGNAPNAHGNASNAHGNALNAHGNAPNAHSHAPKKVHSIRGHKCKGRGGEPFLVTSTTKSFRQIISL